jgi:anti-sigma factor RsiW
MKTFEEKWTAWLDGQLTGKELEEFEASLPDRAAAELEKQEAGKLSVLLKTQVAAPAMTNVDFFHHQLRTEIERDARAAAQPASRRETRASWWSIRRLAWSAATALVLASGITYLTMRDDNIGGQSLYTQNVLNARLGPEVNSYATISMFETKEDKVTVLWVDGLQSLPSEYAAK